MNSPMVPNSGGSIANARWADPEYVSDRYVFEPGKIWIGRDPIDSERAIGYLDDRHVLVCAGSRSGKGRSFIVNNLAVWPGSVVAYDPKGELPRILAARRSHDGDDYCEGMEQDVFVLDPLNKSGVDSKYLGYFDPLAALHPDDDELATWTKRIANALIEVTEGTESSTWAKRARNLIALIIDHVVTSQDVAEADRNLMTVLRLLLEGREEDARIIKERHGHIIDPMELLLDEISENAACNGWIASEARNLRRISEKIPRYFESVRSEATDQLHWFKSGGIARTLQGWGNPSRRLDPAKLKSDPHGIAVFIVMPVEDLDTYKQWVETVFLGIFAAMRNTPGQAASGHQTLCVLDEFLSIGKQESIVNAMDNIAGAGMKLAIIVQNIGGLKELYKDRIDSFYSNCGVELFFGKIGQDAAEYLSKQLGETEVVRTARSFNRSKTEQHGVSSSTSEGSNASETDTQSFGKSRSDTEGESKSQTETQSENWSDSQNFSESESQSDGKNWSQSENSSQSKNWNEGFSWNQGTNWSNSQNWGQSEGKTAGRNFGPHIFGCNYSDSYNINRSSGRSATEGGSTSQGKNIGHGGSVSGGTSTSLGGNTSNSISKTLGGAATKGGAFSHATSLSTSKSHTQSTSQTIGKSWQRGSSQTASKGESHSQGYQIGTGYAETFHKKPLLEIHEINSYLRSYEWNDRDHPAYPGLAVVRVDGEPPFFVRRSNYDQDAFFERCFSPDGVHDLLPLHDRPLLGYQYTSDHVVELRIPDLLAEKDYQAEALLGRFSWFEKGEPIFEYYSENDKLHFTVCSPYSGRVLNPELSHDNSFMLVRFDQAIPGELQQALEHQFFAAGLELARQLLLKRIGKQTLNYHKALQKDKLLKEEELLRKKDEEAERRRQQELNQESKKKLLETLTAWKESAQKSALKLLEKEIENRSKISRKRDFLKAFCISIFLVFLASGLDDVPGRLRTRIILAFCFSALFMPVAFYSLGGLKASFGIRFDDFLYSRRLLIRSIKCEKTREDIERAEKKDLKNIIIIPLLYLFFLIASENHWFGFSSHWNSPEAWIFYLSVIALPFYLVFGADLRQSNAMIFRYKKKQEIADRIQKDNNSILRRFSAGEINGIQLKKIFDEKKVCNATSQDHIRDLFD